MKTTVLFVATSLILGFSMITLVGPNLITQTRFHSIWLIYISILKRQNFLTYCKSGFKVDPNC